MRVPKFLYGLVAAGALVLTTQTAEAALTLKLEQGAATETITDGGVGDANAAAGAVTFVGVVGTYTLNVTTGVSKPVLPNTGASAEMDLNSVNVSGGAGAALVISLSDTGFTLDSLNMSGLLDFGGTTDGLVSVQFYIGLDNALFSTDVLIADLGAFGPGAFSGSEGLAFLGADPFSLTIVATITHGSGTDATSFNAHGKVSVPTPGTLSLFLAGLIALATGAYGARQHRRAAAA